MSDPTSPSPATRDAEAHEANRRASADRAPTAEEEALAERTELDESVAEHEKEMVERGARQQGEGRIP
jgi:hypothetical protein